jgi:L-ascorbate metabolism protein UlaG (beta-lactamase superfamily)
MNDLKLKLRYIGGPTATIEMAGLRFLTDPTFDPAGSTYPTKVYTLTKTQGPSIMAEALGAIEVVLLSHDHHFDNLDRAGRAFLKEADQVLTTVEGAIRLGGNAVGLKPLQTITVPARDGRIVEVTATPARHGPEGGDRGPVIGFLLSVKGSKSVYVSGDTVLYEGVIDVAKKFDVAIALLNMGAARVKEVGPSHLTFTVKEAVELSRLFGEAKVVPLHYEGWQHFSESEVDIKQTFDAEGLSDRLAWISRNDLVFEIGGEENGGITSR